MRGASADMTTAPSPRSTTAAPCTSGANQHARVRLRRVDQRLEADHGAVREGRDAGLEVQDLRDGHRHHRPAAGRHQRRELPDALGVRPRPLPDVDDGADLEHVAAVERAGRLDPGDLHAEPCDVERGDGAGRRVDLAHPRRRAGPGEHGQVVDHDDGVLDEHPVRVLVGGLDLVDGPPAVGEHRDVALPLAQREIGVHRGAGEVGQLPVREPRGGPADQDARSRDHARTLARPHAHAQKPPRVGTFAAASRHLRRREYGCRRRRARAPQRSSGAGTGSSRCAASASGRGRR